MPSATRAQPLKGFTPRETREAGSASRRSQPAVSPPKAGPSTKPSPMPAPIMPMPFARSLPSVTSATMAVAVDTLPAMIPPSRRERISTEKGPAKNHMTYERAVPARVRSSTGRRPCRSLRRPQ